MRSGVQPTFIVSHGSGAIAVSSYDTFFNVSEIQILIHVLRDVSRYKYKIPEEYLRWYLRYMYLRYRPALPIPKVDRIRVLGRMVESSGHIGETIRKLDDVMSQIMRLLKRIVRKYSGMKEGNLLRLVQAFVINRIVSVASYLRWHSSERYKLDCLIRKIYKQAIGLSITPSNDSLLQLGLHNTLDELIEAQHIAQYERLSKR